MTDEQIIQLFQNRDERAIEEISKKYKRYCAHIASKVLDDFSDVEECINDTWLGVWNAIPPATPDHLNLFLARIIRNISFSRFRNQNTKKRGNGEVLLVLDELDECLTGQADVEDAYLADELQATINRFVRSLPVREGNIFIRRYYYSESFKEIAQRYRLSENAVRTILFRTRNKLKDCLMKEGYLS